MNSTSFQKGHRRGAAAYSRSVGTVTIRRESRSGNPARWIKVRQGGPTTGRWELFANHWWRQHVGRVPPGYRVMHKDGNTLNDSPDNLVCVDGPESLRLVAELDPTFPLRLKERAAQARRKRAAAEREQAAVQRRYIAELFKRVDAAGLRNTDLSRETGIAQLRVSQIRHGRARVRESERRLIEAALSSVPAKAQDKAPVAAPAKEVARQRIAAFLSQLTEAA